ncbi:MAG: sulfurtransferase TusA family protein [Desulfobacterales bacterium]|nr:MAG: sulfurtransferase TusA family protein [Desulfobacterales bacterium]
MTNSKECDKIKITELQLWERIMAVKVLDTPGLICPQPVLKIAVHAPDMRPGDVLEVLGDCPTFEKAVRTWCERLGRVLLSIKDEGGNGKRIQIQF